MTQLRKRDIFVSKLPIRTGGQSEQREYLLWVEDVLVVSEVERGLHGGVDEPLVELPLAQHQEVVGLGAAPRVVHETGLAWQAGKQTVNSALICTYNERVV